MEKIKQISKSEVSRDGEFMCDDMGLTDGSPFFSGTWQTSQSVSEMLSDVQTLKDKHEEGLHVTTDYCRSPLKYMALPVKATLVSFQFYHE